MEEKNKFKRAWIWFWYNDITRIFIIIGLPIIPIVLLVAYLFGTGEYLRNVALITYGFFLCWLMIDNDYSKLRRIGMDEYRKKL